MRPSLNRRIPKLSEEINLFPQILTIKVRKQEKDWENFPALFYFSSVNVRSRLSYHIPNCTRASRLILSMVHMGSQTKLILTVCTPGSSCTAWVMA